MSALINSAQGKNDNSPEKRRLRKIRPADLVPRRTIDRATRQPADRATARLNKKRAHSEECADVGDDLFSRAAARQVSSAQLSLTTVFGMGTGGTSVL